MLLLIALLAWSVGGICAPVPSMHGMQCMMGGAEPVAAHDCCPPQTTMAMSCHGKRNDAITRCASLADDEAILTTSKFRDNGLSRAAATAGAIDGIAPSPEVSRAWIGHAPRLHARAVLDVKADLRI